MEKRTLGRTGLQVTQLGFGAMEIRGSRIWRGRHVEPAQAETILNAVLDSGINFIDTSYDYGMSEEYIGQFINKRRGEYILATKCGCHLTDAGDHDDTSHIWTRENLMHNLETSLRRMHTDHIDLWQLHNATVADVEKGDLIRVMEDARAAGKVRWIGASAILPHISQFIQWGEFDVYQIPYSALQRAEEGSITKAAQSGAGTIIRGGVAKGAPEDAAPGGGGSADRWVNWEHAKLDDLRGPDESRTSFLLRLTLSHPHMHTTIVGTLNPDHLANNRRIADIGPLPADVYHEALRRLDSVGERSAS